MMSGLESDERTKKSEKVAITGASGFIGGALLDRYRRPGVDAAGLDLCASPEPAIVAADASVRGPWERRLGGTDCVIHTAAAVSNAVGDERAWRINALGPATVRMLDRSGPREKLRPRGAA